MVKNQKIYVLSPCNGDMLNRYDGITVDGKFYIEVKIVAPKASNISVNGTQAVLNSGIFIANIPLEHYKNTLVIQESNSGFSQIITLYYLKNYIKRYRISLDDNIWFLQDIAENCNRYHSIFENPFLALYKRMYDVYGTKIHINLYYQTEGFNLSQMPDKYKEEWKANSHWIKLSFHGLHDTSYDPYIKATYDEVKQHSEAVIREIRRFASEECLTPVTTLHFAGTTVEGCRALRDAGYTTIAGDFNIDENLFPCSYYFNMPMRERIFKRHILKDMDEDIIFSRLTMIVDCYKLEEIVPFLETLEKDLQKSAYLDFCIHEQYFYPHYSAYQPDYAQKVETVVKWASGKGYQPAFLNECVYK